MEICYIIMFHVFPTLQHTYNVVHWLTYGLGILFAGLGLQFIQSTEAPCLQSRPPKKQNT